MAAQTCLAHDDYTVGWICALPLEMAAAKVMLDEIHEDLPLPLNDHNTYILGRVGKHNIVIACLPSGVYGIASAARVGTQLLATFHSIRFGLMVGIGGGIPREDVDIRLGDVVVSKPTDLHGGVVQYDYGKVLSGGKFQRTGMLNRPPQSLSTALAKLQAYHLTEESQLTRFLVEIEQKLPAQRAAKFTRPAREDHLFLSDYNHFGHENKTCDNCDITQAVVRPSRDHQVPATHYGLVASANKVVKDSQLRDRLGHELGALCVEMEAAGLLDNYPCIVIRGICDYADSHKNKEWQGYAAAVAAAYAKELLSVTSTIKVDQTMTARERLRESVQSFRVPLDLATVPVIENFIGRENELEKMWQCLWSVEPHSRKVAILHGLGGIGKTQLAIRFARIHKSDFTAVFWLSGKDESTLLQSMSSAFFQLPGNFKKAKALNDEEVKQQADQLLKWLSLENNSRWLIIYDNIDQYSPGDTGNGYDIYKYFPTADHGSILITSRLQILTELGESLPLQSLDHEHSKQLILQSSGFLCTRTTTEIDSDISTLARRLGGLPLAIVIAGAFIQQTGSSINEYLQYYEESWHELHLQPSGRRQYQQGNIIQTWMTSFYEIKKRYPKAAQLLLLLSHFDNQDVWYELVKGGYHSADAPEWYKEIVSNGLAFKNTMKILIGFSLIETKCHGGSYKMHPVVQDWCLHISSIHENLRPLCLRELAFVSVGYMIPGKDRKDYAEIQRRLMPHAHRIRSENISLDTPAVLMSFHNFGNLYSHQGKLKEAEVMYQRALIGRENALGPDHTSTLAVVNNLGNLYGHQGKPKEAEAMYQRALAGRESVLGPDNTSTLAIVNNLGNLYFKQGKLKEAEAMYQRALAGRDNVLGPDHISTLATVNNLGNLYRHQDKLKEAEAMYQRALIGREDALGPDHTSTLATVNNFGNLYRQLGKLKEAEAMYQRALAGRKNVLGPDHTSTLDTANNLGNLYNHQGKLKEAEAMYQRALIGRENVLGPDHTATLDTVNNLGNLYRHQDKLNVAEAMYQRALAGRENTLGPDNTSTLATVNNLGILYFKQGKLKEAEAMYQQALRGRENALGPDHTSTLDTANSLGDLYRHQGKLNKAEAMYQRALTGRKNVLGPYHILTLDTVKNLGNLYKHQGKVKNAEAMYQQVLAGYESTLGPGHENTLSIAKICVMVDTPIPRRRNKLFSIFC